MKVIAPTPALLSLPLVHRGLLNETGMTSLRFRVAKNKLLAKPLTGEMADIKKSLQSQGYRVVQDGQNLRAIAGGAEGVKTEGVELRVQKTAPATFGVFGKSTKGIEMGLYNSTTGQKIKDFGGIEKPVDVSNKMTVRDIKPPTVTTKTTTIAKDPLKKAKILRQIRSMGMGLDLD